ncbi:MAG: 50S ribosomal protein L11 [Candidatus Wildermuthbacteria bacterium]|nr:50S ribosomal protein L11 [Candidatus Wildermuthbacteria bacterium]
MAKKIKKQIRLHIEAGKATPAPPVGPSLAQHGVNIGEFCQKFNEATRPLQGTKLPVDITVYDDRSYAFVLHQPAASILIKKAAGLEKGSGTPNKSKKGSITQSQLEEIAKQKLPDLNTQDLEAAKRTIAGTAKSLGIEVK